PGKVPAGQNAGTPIPTTGTPDFRMFSCTAGASLGALAGSVINVGYRADGGSVVGGYAPFNNKPVNELEITPAGCLPDATKANQYDCATQINSTIAPPAGAVLINGNTTTNGPHDSYTGAVVSKSINYGVSDLEPGAFGNNTGVHWAGGGNNDPLKA